MSPRRAARLAAWVAVIALFAGLNYAARFGESRPAPPDVLFRWSTSIGTLAIELATLLVLLLIARGIPFSEAFALRRPASWSDALRIGAASLVAIWTTSLVLEATVGHAGREQAIPQYWDDARAPAFVASALAIGVLVPIVEEALCRGLGFTLLLPWGQAVALVGTSLAFALAHGAVADLPWVLVTGFCLGYLRLRSGSVLPSMGLHATVNSLAVLAAGLASRGA